jgi:hypothetical protein
MAKAERTEFDEDVELRGRGLAMVEAPACERHLKAQQRCRAELESHGDEKMQRAKRRPAREFGVNADRNGVNPVEISALTPWKKRGQRRGKKGVNPKAKGVRLEL